jgi:peptide methionine sulfoxide reductase msrA/msrB
MNNDKNIHKSYFASGCFWGTEYWFMKAPGVKATAVGFMGGTVDNPVYQQVKNNRTSGMY